MVLKQGWGRKREDSHTNSFWQRLGCVFGCHDYGMCMLFTSNELRRGLRGKGRERRGREGGGRGEARINKRHRRRQEKRRGGGEKVPSLSWVLDPARPEISIWTFQLCESITSLFCLSLFQMGFTCNSVVAKRFVANSEVSDHPHFKGPKAEYEVSCPGLPLPWVTVKAGGEFCSRQSSWVYGVMWERSRETGTLGK